MWARFFWTREEAARANRRETRCSFGQRGSQSFGVCPLSLLLLLLLLVHHRSYFSAHWLGKMLLFPPPNLSVCVHYIHRLTCVIPDFLLNSRFALDVVEAELTAQFASTASADPALLPRVGTAFRSLTGKRVPHGDGWASLRPFHHVPCVPLQRFIARCLSHPTRDSSWASRALREEKTVTGT